MILLKYRFERNLLIYFSLAYPIARGFISAKKKQKLIGILIAGHNAILPPTNQWIPPGKYISALSFPNFRIPSSKWGKFPWNRSTNIASVFKHRAGKNGFGFRNQGNARSNVSWSTWFEVSYGNWYFFPRLFQLDCISLSLSFCRRASCTTTDGKKRKKDTTRVLMDFDRKYETDVTWREWAAKRIREGNYRCATGKWKRNTRCSSVDVAGRMREMEFRVCLSFPWSPPLSFIPFSSFFFFLSFLDY